MELFLNTRHLQIRQAVLFVGPGYAEWRLKEFIDHTNLDKLILTGFFAKKTIQRILESLHINAANGKQKMPAFFEYCPLEKLTRPEGEYALVVEALEDNQDILPMLKFTPDYLIGEIQGIGISSYTIWKLSAAAVSIFSWLPNVEIWNLKFWTGRKSRTIILK